MIPKFRAWEPDTKFMNDQVRVTSNRFGDGEVLVEDTDGFGWIEVKPEYLMQSTGLKDKNGMEIFEGDLVKVSVDNGFDYLFEELSIVEPSKIHSGLVCSLKSHEAEYRIIHAEILGYEYEVVGNIYENPELLEEKS
ncbi:YopX family protein [Enterococcus casseliflavus]|uniref:YopX family protein n=1 Tax=Enterococcus casseliflavus TaxID=37734 RepID=UPI00232B9FAD|nr:YopX family protein [Enterococcus casseliflavus]MDB1690171.1 YopX family protein [Enterococcus casseliflavus]